MIEPAKTDLKGLECLASEPESGFRRLPGPRTVYSFDGTNGYISSGTPTAADAYCVHSCVEDVAKVYFYERSSVGAFRSEHPMAPKRS